MNENNQSVVLWYFTPDVWTDIDAAFTIITIIITAFTLLYAFLNWLNSQKQLDIITIKFKIDILDKTYILIDNNITRKDLRRSEVQGILANQLIKGETRYNIDYLGKKEYFENINSIQNSNTDTLIIKLEDDEIGQFADLIVSQLNKDEIKIIKTHINTYMNLESGKQEKKLKSKTINRLNA